MPCINSVEIRNPISPPAAEMNEPGNAVGYQWETPRSLSGTWDVYATFIAEGGAGAKETGFSGLAMKITSNEK